MANVLRQNLFLFALFSIFIVGWLLQQVILFNCDVAWLTEASKRMLQGGTYFNDFFENNPPWILYFYLPIAIVNTYFSSDIIHILQIYVLIAASLSLFLSWVLLKKIFGPEDFLFVKIWMLGLAFVFLILPSYEFGQREHFLLMFLMPYLLMVVARLQGEKFRPAFAILVGVLASSVLLMKPYFLPTLLFIELYYSVNKRRFFAWWRPEIIVFLVMGTGYAALLLLRHTDYLFEVMPVALRWCHLSYYIPFQWLIKAPLFFYSVFAVFTYFFAYYYRFNYYLVTILSLALIGFLISYVSQRVILYYHYYPMLAVAFLLYGHFFITNVWRIKYSYLQIAMILFFCMIFIQEVVSDISPYVFSLRNLPVISFLFFLSPLFFLLTQSKSILQFTMRFLIILLMSFIYSYFFITKKIIWNIDLLTIFILSIVLVYGCMSDVSFARKKMNMIYCGYAMLMMMPVIFFVTVIDQDTIVKRANLQPIISVIEKEAPSESIYFLSTHLWLIYPTTTYAKSESASRFAFFWFLGGMVKSQYLSPSLKKELGITDKKNIVRMISEDIQTKKPKLIFVDVSQHKSGFYFYKKMNDQYVENEMPFNFINYFSTENAFREALASYRYLTTIIEPDRINNYYLFKNPYQLDVYERI